MKHIRVAVDSLGRSCLKAYAILVLGGTYPQLRSLSIRRFNGTYIAYRRGTSDEGVLAHSFDRDIFLSGVPKYAPSAGDIVLDVGAHIGDFALMVAQRLGGGRVYAVEACRETYGILCANIALNRASNIAPSHLALAGQDGTCTLFHAPPGESWGDSTTHDYAGNREDVPSRSLRSFLADQNIERVDFAKFNCEGAEFEILLGADPATMRRIGTMLILYHCDLAEAFSEEQLLQHLRDCGFATEVRNRTAERGWIIAQQRLSQD